MLAEMRFRRRLLSVMPSSCAADSCTNRDIPSCPYGFFRFPLSDRERTKLWIKGVCCRRAVDWWPTSGMRICGKHFLKGKPSENPSDVDYVPTIVDIKKRSLEKAEAADARAKIYQKRCGQTNQPEVLASPSEVPSVGPVGVAEEEGCPSPGTCTAAVTDHDVSIDSLRIEVRELKDEVKRLQTEVDVLTAQLAEERYKSKSSNFSVHHLKGSDKLTRFYTGLPTFVVFMSLFEYLQPKAARMRIWRGEKAEAERTASGAEHRVYHRERQLDLVDEFLAVLMRLRLGLLVEDVCQRFGVSPSYYSKIFTTWVVFLAKELCLMFPWSSADKVKLHTPPQFLKYPNTRVIVDCFELFIERPSSLKTNCQAFSHYKNHATFKALIGISPGGVVTYLSSLYTGRASDKFIVSHSGFLDLLEPNDNVMADKGFDIKDLLLPHRVTLNIPPFLRQDRGQFTAQEVDETRSIASLRIHVERAIARVKSFHILNGILPITLTPVANQIVTVCTYLTNFSDPLLSEV